jgi:hypothetical protein
MQALLGAENGLAPLHQKPTDCEEVVESRVSCIFADSFEDYHDGNQNNGFYTEDTYVNYRYHNNHGKNNDDDRNDEYAFDDYDPDSAPQGYSWNKASETAMADCATCQARSLPYVMFTLQTIDLSTHGMFTTFGMALGFLGWPLWTLLYGYVSTKMWMAWMSTKLSSLITAIRWETEYYFENNASSNRVLIVCLVGIVAITPMMKCAYARQPTTNHTF